MSKLDKSSFNHDPNHEETKDEIKNSDISGLNEAIPMPEWITTPAEYDNGRIICKVPSLEMYALDQLQFSVDVALNGQQFTGHPQPFRYYDIQIQKVLPSIGLTDGGVNIFLKGTGIYDSAIKRVKFQTKGGEREVAAAWDRKAKCLSCIVPPLTWLFGGKEIS